MLHLRIFHNEFVRQAVAALFLAVDGLHDILHLLPSEEPPGLFDAAVEGQPPGAGAVLGQHDHVVEQVDHAVGGVGDDDDDFAFTEETIKYSIPCSVLKTFNDKIGENIRGIVEQENARGVTIINEENLLDFAMNRTGLSSFLYRKATYNIV